MSEWKTGNLLVKALSPHTAHKHTHHNVESILERYEGIPLYHDLYFLSHTSLARSYPRQNL